MIANTKIATTVFIEKRSNTKLIELISEEFKGGLYLLKNIEVSGSKNIIVSIPAHKIP